MTMSLVSIAQALQGTTSPKRSRWEAVAEFEDDGYRYVVARTPCGVGALTPREREVIAHLALGESPKVIAFELGVSGSTVRVLLARARARAGARSVDELVQMYMGVWAG
jgi:DNA-binding CsgD family transcriptional regulator